MGSGIDGSNCERMATVGGGVCGIAIEYSVEVEVSTATAALELTLPTEGGKACMRLLILEDGAQADGEALLKSGKGDERY